MTPRFYSILASIILALAVSTVASAQTTQSAPATQPAGPTTSHTPGALPFVKVDLKNKTVDLDATVVMREGKWLELLACKPKSREHESILAVPALASHVHLALIMIGMEPGAPLTWREKDGGVVSIPPHGPGVNITIVTKVDGKEVEAPASSWVLNQKTNKVIPDQPWLFVGSRTAEVQGKTVYYGDVNGSIISLVNFGDDVLVRETPLTNDNDDSTFGANTNAIPPLGTAVTLRLRPAPAATQPATQPK
jgi:hypothetical protein